MEKNYTLVSAQRISTILSKRLVLNVVINGPLQMASDFIENYNNHSAIEFIKAVRVIWDATIELNGEIENYLTIARKDRQSND